MARGTQNALWHIVGKRKATGLAIRFGDKIQTGPARRAQATLGFHFGAAAKAQRGQQEIQSALEERLEEKRAFTFHKVHRT